MSLYRLFEMQVDESPCSPALAFEGNTMTYEELNKKSNQLARKLRDMGVGRNNIVGLLTERSFEMIIGILGIMKAGGTYLPIDPAYPVGRICFMLEDSGAGIVLTDNSQLAIVNARS